MKKNIWEKRIPTLLGIFIITIGIVVTSVLVKNGAIFIGKAAPSEEPQNLRISNITDSSFTVSYITEAVVLGSVSFGKDQNMGTTALDDRDQQEGSAIFHQVHYITVRNLVPSTRFYFSVTSGQNKYLNNDLPFEVTTASSLEAKPPDQKPMAGKILLTDGTAPKEAVIFVTESRGQTLSTLTKPDGSYIIPFNSMRDKDLNGYLSFASSDVLKMLVVGPKLKSNINLLASQINPVPLITLSKDYDFTISSSALTSENSSGSAVIESSFSSFSTNSISSKNIEITSPKKDDSFKDQQPLFSGTASPGASIKILIQSSNEIQTQVAADRNGFWSYRPTSPLAPGKHTISIITRDNLGILKTISQTFTVFAQGTQVSGSATPSATPILSPSVTAAPILSITSLPTPTISTVTPTPTITVLTTVPSLTPIPTLPPTGNTNVVGIGIGAITVTIFGALLFLLTRGSISL